LIMQSRHVLNDSEPTYESEVSNRSEGRSERCYSLY
jgi:hypothetical protein